MNNNTIVNCRRCGRPCQLSDSSTEDARLLRAATTPETAGYCPDCGTTDFFKNHSPFGQIIEFRGTEGKAMLLDPRVQTQFAGLLRTGRADARPEEINWQNVYDHWDLPFPKGPKSKQTRK
jgi:hypothetical protein